MDNAAASYNINKDKVKNWIYENFDENASILDVGAGRGTYKNLLGDGYRNIDAVEIYYPNIIDYKLHEKYRFVSNKNVIGLEYPHYNLIIFGDVIEHMSVEDAQNVLEYARMRCDDLIVAVPYRYFQNGNENKWEEHIQNDLTQQNILERYPYLGPLFIDPAYGYYHKK